MIGRLTGRLAEKSPDQLILDVGGVGYLVHIPLSTFYELPEAESPTSLFVHTHVREDTLALYGFLTERERSLFLLLLSVAGIGPRVALTVLSGIPPVELVEALRSQDVRRLIADSRSRQEDRGAHGARAVGEGRQVRGRALRGLPPPSPRRTSFPLSSTSAIAARRRTGPSKRSRGPERPRSSAST